ncbi:MAG: exonuclease domain-containing protein [Clostridia bacterium]|nr:exonuclease domain-containing protein [Clostridia bacterium]
MQGITATIKEKTNGRYGDLRLKRAVFSKSVGVVTFSFTTMKALSEGQREEIAAIVKASEFAALSFAAEFSLETRSVKSILNSVVSFTKSDFFSVFKFLEETPKAIKVEGDGEFKVTFTVDSDMARTFEQMSYVPSLTEYLQSVYASNISVELIEKQEADFDLAQAVKDIDYRQDLAQLVAMGTPKREVLVERIGAVVGKEVSGNPIYISDVEEGNVVICGNVIEVAAFDVKKEASKVKKVYKYTIEDFTGKMKVVYFAKEDDKDILKVHMNDTILVFGKAAVNETAHEMQVVAKCITYCHILKGEKINVLSVEPNADYIVVKPQPYEKIEQQSLLDVLAPTKKEGDGKTYVAFDFETTGLKALEDKIIEIGAVKIENGEITEIFSTFINPQRPIGASSTQITGITDDMVADAPVITAVIPDLYKFCYGSTIIAHNIDFDYAFLQYYSEPTGYIFNNPREDTLALAKAFFRKKENLKNSPPNFKLQSIARVLNVHQDEAHRAYDDARVCAEIFLKMQ